MDFLIFPDHPATGPLLHHLPRWPTTRTVPHPSGRPWIVGHWSDDAMLTATAGPRRAALLGTTSADRDTLLRLLRGLRTHPFLDRALHQLPGSFFQLTAMDGKIHCRGTLATVRQLHHAAIGGVTVAGNRPQDLATLARAAAAAGLPTGAPDTGEVDEEVLALRLLAPFPPLPLALRPPWRSIHAVPPGHQLVFHANGRHTVRRWWYPPEPHAPLPDAAAALREALRGAVRARLRQPTLSADLSGGMDSTSLCFLAAEGADRLITTAWECRDPANDDPVWSARSAAHLTAGGRPGVHLRIFDTDAPTWYAPPAGPAHTDPAGPLAVVREVARLAHQARLVADRGSRTHLIGVGGDELFAIRPAALNSLARRDVRAAARHTWQAHHLGHWTLTDTLRTLAGGRSYPRWLARTAARTAPGSGRAPTGADWEAVPHLPPWTHPDVTATVRRLLRQAAAADPEPLALLRAQHDTVRAAARAGEIVRGMDVVTSRNGVSCEAPFLDDAVIEAALTVRLADTTTVGAYKPLLAAAMRGIVPDAVLGRGTKGEHSAEVYAGLRRHRTALTALCEDSLLARRGLIRPDALRQVVTSLHPETHALRPLDPTLAAEYWLRGLPHPAPPAAAPEGAC